MAIIKSSIINAASGSIGGVTYFHNRYATLIARQKVIPVNPLTPCQEKIRAFMSNAVTRWFQNLTDEQRQKWDAYADTLIKINDLGDSYSPTGQNQFVGAYTGGGYHEIPGWIEATCDIAPGSDEGPATPPKINCAAYAGITVGIGVSVTNLDKDAMYGIVQVGPSLSKGISFYNGPWRCDLTTLTGSLTEGADETVSIDVGAAAGETIPVRVKVYSNVALHRPRYSGWFHLFCETEAAP